MSAWNELLPADGGALLRANRHKIGWPNPAIQIICQSRKNDSFHGFPTYWRRLCRFDAAEGVTAAG